MEEDRIKDLDNIKKVKVNHTFDVNHIFNIIKD